MLFLDIDRFKLVNDSLSHAVGDQLLIALAGRISGALRPGDTVARHRRRRVHAAARRRDDGADAAIIAERVQHALGQSFSINRHQLFLTVSIGISLSSPGLNAADLCATPTSRCTTPSAAAVRARRYLTRACASARSTRLERENELREAIEIACCWSTTSRSSTLPPAGCERSRLWLAGRRTGRPWLRSSSSRSPRRPGSSVCWASMSCSAHCKRCRAGGGAVWWPRTSAISVNVSGLQLDDPMLPEPRSVGARRSRITTAGAAAGDHREHPDARAQA